MTNAVCTTLIRRSANSLQDVVTLPLAAMGLTNAMRTTLIRRSANSPKDAITILLVAIPLGITSCGQS